MAAFLIVGRKQREIAEFVCFERFLGEGAPGIYKRWELFEQLFPQLPLWKKLSCGKTAHLTQAQLQTTRVNSHESRFPHPVQSTL